MQVVLIRCTTCFISVLILPCKTVEYQNTPGCNGYMSLHKKLSSSYCISPLPLLASLLLLAAIPPSLLPAVSSRFTESGRRLSTHAQVRLQRMGLACRMKYKSLQVHRALNHKGHGMDWMRNCFFELDHHACNFGTSTVDRV